MHISEFATELERATAEARAEAEREHTSIPFSNDIRRDITHPTRVYVGTSHTGLGTWRQQEIKSVAAYGTDIYIEVEL